MPSQAVFALTSLCCIIIGKAANTNFIVFSLTRQRLELTIYRTRGEHANHYTTDADPNTVTTVTQTPMQSTAKATDNSRVHKSQNVIYCIAVVNSQCKKQVSPHISSAFWCPLRCLGNSWFKIFVIRIYLSKLVSIRQRFVSLSSNTTDATSRVETTYPSRAPPRNLPFPSTSPDLGEVLVAQYF